MYEERLAEFSRARLDGRPIPNDLRTMLVAQWEGRTDFQYLLDITFFADQLAALGLPLSTRDYDALYDDDYAVDPEKLTDELIERRARETRHPHRTDIFRAGPLTLCPASTRRVMTVPAQLLKGYEPASRPRRPRSAGSASGH